MRNSSSKKVWQSFLGLAVAALFPLSAAAANETVWQIGQFDKSTLEYPLQAASLASQKIVETPNDLVYIVGKSQTEDWPRFQRWKGYPFHATLTEDGLSQTKVSQIVQDDQGFMWFGSQYELNRYDSYKFKMFKHEPGRTNSLSGVLIYSLFKDRSGSLCIGCDEFLDKFDPVTETFTHYPIDTDSAQGETVPVTNISQDQLGMLWLLTSKGLYRFDPSSGRIVRYRHDPNDPFSLSSDEIKATLEDKTGTFWK